MKVPWLPLPLVLAACAAFPAAPTAVSLDAYPDARGMPADVQRFIVRWQDCVHWLGEPPFDAERARQIEAAVKDTCPGVDALGTAVRKRHAGKSEVLARIADYEPLDQ